MVRINLQFTPAHKARHKCLACHEEGRFLPLVVCVGCFASVEKGTFGGCARCGNALCPGSCAALEDYVSVLAPYRYAPPFSDLLGRAKGRQEGWAQMVFSHLFTSRAARCLEHAGRADPGFRVVLSPLRFSRALDTHWHTHGVLLRAAETVRPQGVTRQQADFISLGWNARRARQASTPSKERRARVSKAAASVRSPQGVPSQGGHEGKEGKEGALRCVRTVVVVDDVLTSGETALEIARALRSRASFANARLVLFCLFRTPVDTEEL